MSDSKKENIIENTKNFIPYGTDPKKDNIVKSNYWGVRLKMAKEGYGLNVLINDEDYGVLKATLNYLRKNNLTLAEWCNQNNKEIDLKNLAYSPYPEIRIVAIKLGYIYKENEIYIAPECKFTPYGTNPEKNKMVKSYYPKDRLEMAKEGYGLNLLINDEDWAIRRAVVRQGYGLDILINDEDCDVRIAVVNQGYGLDVLINDEDWSVQDAVEDYLAFHNLTLEQWKSNQEHSKTNIINQAKNAINDGKIDVKNVADSIKSTKSVLNDSINKTNKTNEIEPFKLD